MLPNINTTMKSSEFIREHRHEIGQSSPGGTHSKKNKKLDAKQHVEELMTEDISKEKIKITVSNLYTKLSNLPGFIEEFKKIQENKPLAAKIMKELLTAKKDGVLTKDNVIDIIKANLPVTEISHKRRKKKKTSFAVASYNQLVILIEGMIKLVASLLILSLGLVGTTIGVMTGPFGWLTIPFTLMFMIIALNNLLSRNKIKWI